MNDCECVVCRSDACNLVSCLLTKANEEPTIEETVLYSYQPCVS